ncbi:MAG TPA: DUF402 domain-containing protein [Candidatus Limnocylindrales bacterium]|nr:DUF402 domain-containing protein [Candidatus Limnocylindrales bacterium]
MYRLIRIDKRIPDGSIWQARQGYLLDAVGGWTRVLGPTGTRWSNPLGGWTTQHEGLSLFHHERPFTISCHGPATAKRFYIDIAHRVRITPVHIEFVDLFLDVMIDSSRSVSEKDEHQLAALSPELQAFARSARDLVRGLIAARDALFDADSSYYAIPADATGLPAPTEPIAL